MNNDKNVNKLCSIIVPCFNEQDAIPIYYNEMLKHFKEFGDLDFEFWFINDGSTDKGMLYI